MFWNILLDLCEKHGTNPTALTQELHIAGGNVTKWKNGSIPHDSTLKKIADYFGVEIGYLKGKEKKPIPEDELDRELLREFASLTDEEKAKLMKLMQNPEKLRSVLALL